MKLRAQILVFLLIFGLTPLLGAVVINLPLVFGNLELFYHKAYLQNLRADFRDLDQHLASRHEMVRLLAKLPEPGTILGETDDKEQIDLARARYTQWINQILQDQLDIIQIVFLDDLGQARFWLERHADSHQWLPTTQVPDRPPEDFLRAAGRMEPGGVLVSRIRLHSQPDPRRLMSLYMLSPIADNPDGGQGMLGSVYISVDVGGIARFYRNTLWVNNNGSYVIAGQPPSEKPQAFADFPGLEQIFERDNLDLWKGPGGQQVIWVPMFLTEDSGPLWVGRQVDPSPLAAFRNSLTLRVLGIILGLVIMVMILARWIAVRLERFGQELRRGIGLMLKEDQVVAFNWKGPREVRALGDDLTELAKTHSEHARTLREHARELEESNRYKSEFLANVSHELRTPLNSILLLSKMLAEPQSGLSPVQTKQASVIHQAGKDLQTLIDNILDHSRIDAGEVSLLLEWQPIQPLIDNLVELVQPQFDQKGLYLALEWAPDCPAQIRSDGDKVRQILKNFLSNAVKFTERGGVVIRVEGLGQGSHAMAIRVRDSGIGIPADKQDLVFEAFKQADGSTSRRFGGTGLGLSISRELARLLGGRIELDSREGQGSTFSLLLPLDPEGSASEPPPLPRPPPPVAEPRPAPSNEPRFQGQRVLVVARELGLLLEWTPLLESWGLEVSAAADRDETLESLRDEPCALVLLDLDMSVADGCATIRAVRNEFDSQQLPILVLTNDEDSVGPCVAAGAAEVARRPSPPARLRDILGRYLPVS